MKDVVWFKDLNKSSIPLAGGKGANLGEMYNLGLPVPSGFVITAQTYLYFITETKLKDKIYSLLKNLDIEKTEKLQSVSRQIQNLITQAKIPPRIKENIIENYAKLNPPPKEVFVAVRSSATAEDLPDVSFAGQQASFLNVKGKERLVKAVQECWASLFTARAIYYREKNQFSHEKVLIAVIVQQMVNSDKSGIMFTINPSTNDNTELIIESVYGLGEAIVSGSVNPHLYILDKNSLNVKKIELKKQDWGLFRNKEGRNEKRKVKDENKQNLTAAEIKELAKLGKKIERHYGWPQDIEWAIEKGHILIVQSRPVTTYRPLSKESVKNENLEHSKEAGKILLRGETASGGLYSGPVKIIRKISELKKIKKGDILVTVMTTPDMVPEMQKAGAIITDEGGMACHASIVSREMGIPCIVGTEHATSLLKDNQIVTVHASQGVVYEGKIKIKPIVKEQTLLPKSAATVTKIKVILDLPEKAESLVKKYHPDGVGLVRLEFIIAAGGIHPAEYLRQNKDKEYTALLVNNLKKIARAFKGKPVWVRCSDLRTDEYRNLKGGSKEPSESDPMIGWHGIRRLLDQPRLLQAEFQAIKQLHQKGLKNIGVMLPFVINVEELKQAKEIMGQTGLKPCQEVEFGVMIETPAACWIIEELCKEGISFVSFGTNDLTQLTLGLDRNNERLAKLFKEMHPAVLGEMAKVIKVCKRYKVKTSICGQAGSRPEMAEFLVHQGIGSVSTNSDAFNQIKNVIFQTEQKLLLGRKRK